MRLRTLLEAAELQICPCMNRREQIYHQLQFTDVWSKPNTCQSEADPTGKAAPARPVGLYMMCICRRTEQLSYHSEADPTGKAAPARPVGLYMMCICQRTEQLNEAGPSSQLLNGGQFRPHPSPPEGLATGRLRRAAPARSHKLPISSTNWCFSASQLGPAY